MSDLSPNRLEDYYRDAQSWAEDRQRAVGRSVRLAWIIAGIAAVIATLEAFALFMLIPLKREVPYTLLVDRQTGFVQALRPLDAQSVTADSALTRSFLVQYVIAREGFSIDGLQENYRKVGLWSSGEARARYIASMTVSSPESPLASLPRGATIDVEIRSISSMSPRAAMVRFSTIRADPGGRPQTAQLWIAIITYQYSNAAMSEQDRLTNPLGFQVIRYRKNAETLPREVPQALPTALPDIPVARRPEPGRSLR